MNIDVPVSDDRRIEVVANGLSLWHGAQQAVDATILSPSRGRVRPSSPAQTCTPAMLLMAPPNANAIKPIRPLLGAEAATWLRLLAGQRALDTQRTMRAAACAAWVARWSGLLAVAAQRAIAASLLELPLAGECNVAGEAPELHEVLVSWQLPVTGSRQGLVSIS